MRERRVQGVLGALTGLLVAVTACAHQPMVSRSSAPESGGWAARAEAWVRAFTGAKSLVERLPFYDPDVVVDARGFQSAVSYGWGGLLELPHRWDVSASLHGLAVVEPPYLSGDGAVLRTSAPLGSSVVDMAWTVAFGPAGVTRQSFAGSRWGIRTIDMTPAQYGMYYRFGADVLPGRYLRAWTSGDPGTIAALYAERALVRDTLAGAVLTGRRGIGGAVAGVAHNERGAPWLLRGALLGDMPQGRGDAVFGNNWVLTGPTDRVVLLVDAEIAAGCRGHVAVALDIKNGLVSRDERFYRVDDARRCLAGGGLPDGWWSRVRIPAASSFPITRVSVPGRVATTVWNGNPAADALLLWGYGRFAEAGLPPPAVEWARVVAAEPAVCLTSPRRPLDPMLSVCGGRSGPTPLARAAVLQALARHWLEARAHSDPVCWTIVTQPGRTGCVRPVVDEAAQRAADVVAWGLMDQPWLPARFGGSDPIVSADPASGVLSLGLVPASSCRSLAAQFQRLTGMPPLQRCSGEDGG